MVSYMIWRKCSRNLVNKRNSYNKNKGPLLRSKCKENFLPTCRDCSQQATPSISSSTLFPLNASSEGTFHPQARGRELHVMINWVKRMDVQPLWPCGSQSKASCLLLISSCLCGSGTLWPWPCPDSVSPSLFTITACFFHRCWLLIECLCLKVLSESLDLIQPHILEWDFSVAVKSMDTLRLRNQISTVRLQIRHAKSLIKRSQPPNILPFLPLRILFSWHWVFLKTIFLLSHAWIA